MTSSLFFHFRSENPLRQPFEIRKIVKNLDYSKYRYKRNRDVEVSN